jgi:subtilase family protein
VSGQGRFGVSRRRHRRAPGPDQQFSIAHDPLEADMTESGDWHENVVPKVADETDLIVRSFAEAPDPKVIEVFTVNGGIDFMCSAGEILIREDQLDQVLEILELPSGTNVEPVIEGVVLLPLEGARYSAVVDAVEVIEQQLASGIATPNQVLTVATGTGSGCSATEPQEVYFEIEPFPSVCHDNGGAGVLIYMADTGLLQDAATHPWLASGVQMQDPVNDVDPLDPGTPPVIPACAGHGTFGAGVLRCMAPDSEIIMARALIYGGSEVESDLVRRLGSALALGPDIFHLTMACLSRNDQPLIGFEAWLRLLRRMGAICLAPAGNCGFDRPEFPAAFPGVIGVGALGGDWRGRATFSNFGPWVDVYAPGRDLVNAFATGTYECYVYPYAGPPPQVRNFYGMAKWSGTSFSTPIVTGLIAARMSRTGESSRQAAAAVLAEARAQAIPGVGPVLLPCCHDHHACARPPGCGCRTHQHHPHDC